MMQLNRGLVYVSFIFVFFLTGPVASAGKEDQQVRLLSPDGQLRFELNVSASEIAYDILFRGNQIIERSPLSLDFEDNGLFGQNLQVLKPKFNEVRETYELVVGKTKRVVSHCNEVRIPLIEGSQSKRRIDLLVRAYNDGIAFRYEFPEQINWLNYTLLEERSTFNVAGDPLVYAMMWGKFTSSHENYYQKILFNELKEDTLLDVPSLFQFPDHTFLAITEADLRNYAGMYLAKKGGILTSVLSPLPGQTRIKVQARLPHRTPWRVLMISDRIGDLIESNILTNLCEPSEIDDTSWIHPGKTTFHWWNGDVVPDTTFAPGINFQTNKYYIDFCARNNIEYHAVIGYGGIAWFENNWKGYGSPGSYADVTKPVPSLDIQKVCDYAKEKGVGIHVWVHWKALYPQLEEAFSQFEKWGVKGMMVDFLNRDDQEMVNIQEGILRCAARHKLYIQFHGAYKPTGLHRTFPNEFTREGTLNYEQNKWIKGGLSPDHDVMIPFTRLLAGPADYHLGGFRAVPPEDFKIQYTRPLMIGTRAHMLAMYVVLESYLASLCDYPKAYEGQAGFEFITTVPTVWDETKVLDGVIGEYIIIARRKGTAWYIGGINNTQPRSVNINFDFLKKGTFYKAMIYGDDANCLNNPNNLLIKSKKVSPADDLQIDLCPGGGMALKLIQTKD